MISCVSNRSFAPWNQSTPTHGHGDTLLGREDCFIYGHCSKLAQGLTIVPAATAGALRGTLPP